ncbi:MAG: hypothetical protein QG673_513 [Pseudomonadota bacterium]|nr:hypothetical protein [Pseudomonadota bacterium]
MAINREYVSETDEFINNLLKQKPELKIKQQILRSTWWDTDFINAEEQQEYAQGTVLRPGYVYFNYTNKNTHA